MCILHRVPPQLTLVVKPILEITNNSTNFLTVKKIPIPWIELQTNKSTKGLKTLHLNTER